MRLKIKTESVPESKELDKEVFELQWGVVTVIGKIHFYNPTDKKISIEIYAQGNIERKKKLFKENIILFSNGKKDYHKLKFTLKPKCSTTYGVIVDLQEIKSKIVPKEALSPKRFLPWVYWAWYNGSLIVTYNGHIKRIPIRIDIS